MELFSDTTLYYYFSTIAQVVAATVALISIALQFKVNTNRKYLIGDGQAVYNRLIAHDAGYELDDKYVKRLRDAIEKEDLNGIGDILSLLKDNEIKKNKDKPITLQPFGFVNLHARYSAILMELDDIKTMIVNIVLLSMITITLSISALGLADAIKKMPTLLIIAVSGTFLLFILTMRKNYLGIKLGLK